jgi:hypothetical protein
MVLKQVSWRRSNQALFLFSLLLVPTYLFSADPWSAAAAAAGGGDADSLYNLTQCFGSPEESASFAGDDIFEDDTVLPDHVVKSCLNNMPPILQGIHRYLKSPDSQDPDLMMPAFHRFLLAGPTGTSKSVTSLAIAQDLGVPKEVYEASHFLGKFRSHTAVNIRKIFERLLAVKKRRVVIFNEPDRLFEGHANTHTDHGDTAHTVWSGLDDIQRKNPNIIIIWAMNHPERLPIEMKSRFRLQYAYLPMSNTATWLPRVGSRVRERPGRRIAFSCIPASSVGVSDPKSEEDDIKMPDIAELQKAVGDGVSLRDEALVDDAIVIFAYSDYDASAGGDLVMTDKHKAQALRHFMDKDKVLDYRAEQEPEAEIQRRRHEESMDLQRASLQQQKELHDASIGQQKTQHEASIEQSSFHQAQGIRANLQAQAHQRAQESKGFNVGTGFGGMNTGRTSAPGFSEETAADLEEDILTDEQKRHLQKAKGASASTRASASAGASSSTGSGASESARTSKESDTDRFFRERFRELDEELDQRQEAPAESASASASGGAPESTSASANAGTSASASASASVGAPASTKSSTGSGTSESAATRATRGEGDSAPAEGAESADSRCVVM